LTSRDVPFQLEVPLYVDILSVSPMYIFPQEQDILYTLLSGGLILRISQDLFDLLWRLENDSDVVFVQNPAEIRSIVPFTHERRGFFCLILSVIV